jgi:hypothetical protein
VGPGNPERNCSPEASKAYYFEAILVDFDRPAYEKKFLTLRSELLNYFIYTLTKEVSLAYAETDGDYTDLPLFHLSYSTVRRWRDYMYSKPVKFRSRRKFFKFLCRESARVQNHLYRFIKAVFPIELALIDSALYELENLRLPKMKVRDL